MRTFFTTYLLLHDNKKEREMKNDEEESFEDELLRIQEYLYRFAYKLTCDTERAKDLVQETSLKILDNKGRYIRNENFKGWACRVMRNIFLNKNPIKAPITVAPPTPMAVKSTIVINAPPLCFLRLFHRGKQGSQPQAPQRLPRMPCAVRHQTPCGFYH